MHYGTGIEADLVEKKGATNDGDRQARNEHGQQIGIRHCVVVNAGGELCNGGCKRSTLKGQQLFANVALEARVRRRIVGM